jgi:hypothetical protein
MHDAAANRPIGKASIPGGGGNERWDASMRQL